MSSSIPTDALFSEAVDEDIAALEERLKVLRATLPPTDGEQKKIPKRTALPERFPRRDVHHEPKNTTCSCGCAMKRIGEDISVKLASRQAPSRWNGMCAASGP